MLLLKRLMLAMLSHLAMAELMKLASLLGGRRYGGSFNYHTTSVII